MEESKDQMEKEMLEKIGKLEKELENANDLLSATKRKGVTKTLATCSFLELLKHIYAAIEKLDYLKNNIL